MSEKPKGPISQIEKDLSTIIDVKPVETKSTTKTTAETGGSRVPTEAQNQDLKQIIEGGKKIMTGATEVGKIVGKIAAEQAVKAAEQAGKVIREDGEKAKQALSELLKQYARETNDWRIERKDEFDKWYTAQTPERQLKLILLSISTAGAMSYFGGKGIWNMTHPKPLAPIQMSLEDQKFLNGDSTPPGVAPQGENAPEQPQPQREAQPQPQKSPKIEKRLPLPPASDLLDGLGNLKFAKAERNQPVGDTIEDALVIAFKLEGATNLDNIANYKKQKGENFYTSDGGVTSEEAVEVLVKKGKIPGLSVSEWNNVKEKGEVYTRMVADKYLEYYQGDKSIIFEVYCDKFILPLLKQNLPPELVLARSQAIINRGVNGEPNKIWKPALKKFLQKNSLPESTVLKGMSNDLINELINIYLVEQRRDYARLSTNPKLRKFYEGWLYRNTNTKKMIAKFRDSDASDKLETQYDLNKMSFSVNENGKIEITTKK